MSTTLFIIINPITSKITLIRSKIFPITVLNSGLAYTGFIILIKTNKITGSAPIIYPEIFPLDVNVFIYSLRFNLLRIVSDILSRTSVKLPPTFLWISMVWQSISKSSLPILSHKELKLASNVIPL